MDNKTTGTTRCTNCGHAYHKHTLESGGSVTCGHFEGSMKGGNVVYCSCLHTQESFTLEEQFGTYALLMRSHLTNQKMVA